MRGCTCSGTGVLVYLDLGSYNVQYMYKYVRLVYYIIRIIRPVPTLLLVNIVMFHEEEGKGKPPRKRHSQSRITPPPLLKSNLLQLSTKHRSSEVYTVTPCACATAAWKVCHGDAQGNTVKLLEIGLGCNMIYGPGKSVSLLKTWFHSIDLHEMEYDQACVDKWGAII